MTQKKNMVVNFSSGLCVGEGGKFNVSCTFLQIKLISSRVGRDRERKYS